MTPRCQVCDAETDAFVCTRCLRRTERALGDVPALLAELAVTISRQAHTYRAAGSHRDAEPLSDPEAHLNPFLRSDDGRIALRASTLPYDDGASEVRWELLNTLGTWARHLAESRGVTAPGDGALLGWLLGNVDTLRFDEAGGEAVDEIGYAVGRGWRAVDRSADRVYAGPCRTEDAESCCTRDLYADVSRGRIVCDGWRSGRRGDEGCRASHDWGDRRGLLLASVEDALLPLDDLRDGLCWLLPGVPEPPSSTWRSWRYRGRLVPHGLDRHGRELFRGGDVIELVRDATLRRRGAA